MENTKRLKEVFAPVVAGIFVLLTLIGVIGLAIRDPRPHEIPVAVAGPAPVVQQLTQAFAANAPGAFKISAYDSEASARSAVDAREAVAALVVAPSGPRMVIAGAAGDAVAGGVTAAFTSALKAQGATLVVETVRPFQAGDAHGLLLFFLVFATLLSSLIAGALGGLRVAASRRSIGAVIGFAIAAGVLGPVAVAWLAEGYGDRLWQVMALSALLAFAVASVTAGLARIVGPPGVALSALVLVLLAVISAGGPLGSEMLPDAYRAIAPWLPAGPAYSALRGAMYFDGAGVGGPVTLLLAYAVVGLLLMALRQARGASPPSPAPPAA